MTNSPVPAAVIFGCAGPVLTEAERALFAAANPLGFILFRRNCETPEQVAALTAALRDSVGRPDAPIMIDQEGGRVARLRPPHWPSLPPAGRIGAIADDGLAKEAAWLHGRLLAAMLAPLGIDMDCAPVADVPQAGAHDVIGDRAFGHDPARVALLAGAQAEGLLAGGVLPIVKHLPGHGRALADSHKELPTVTADLATLDAVDFAPFKALAHLPAGMVAHILFTAVDARHPSSTSALVITKIVRERIGFDGLLFSDDLDMQALSGTRPERAAAVVADGCCDVALHCNGTVEDMAAVAAVVPPLTAQAQERWARAQALRPHQDTDADAATIAAWRARLIDLAGNWD
ncbi:beta-N-acetylhexosaminidase [Nitrospirillum pindoramense]|uniref:beta-N-acetylhexosaminidase n=1 Tax=Nitrospirillum amazonense TaxID=28077 RepID=A0A560HBJ1_9PROT|nr:beta-N-acetylhexosaminidase [Nitrospirillum amazonense]TWB43723.1 beta-N-acetylhexosaminidase [Nitrospirillum amazonense]